MRVAGDAGATLEFSAYDLGERALAWIVEERALRAALVPRACRGGDHACAPALASLAWSADARRAALRRRRRADRAARRRRRRRALLGARGARASPRITRPYGQTAVVANFACERAHHGRARQWFRADGGILAWLPLPGRRMSIVWSAPEPRAPNCWRSTRRRSRRVVADGGRPRPRRARVHHPGRRRSRCNSCGCRRSSRTASRWSAMPRTASIRSPARASTSASATPRRWRRCCASAARSPTPAPPLLLERYARQRVEPVLAMQAVTDGLAHLFRREAPWIRSTRNLGMAAVDRLPLAKRLLAQSALR